MYNVTFMENDIPNNKTGMNDTELGLNGAVLPGRYLKAKTWRQSLKKKINYRSCTVDLKKRHLFLFQTPTW